MPLAESFAINLVIYYDLQWRGKHRSAPPDSNHRKNLDLGFRAGALFCNYNPMKVNRRHCNAPGKDFGAYLCLLAIVLLWAPAWVAAFQAPQMACCTAGMCPLDGHVPKRSSGDESGRRSTQTTDCSQHQRQAAMDCNAACCRPPDRTVAAAVVFVLPAAARIAVPLFSGKAALARLPRADFLIYSPPSPPPRS